MLVADIHASRRLWSAAVVSVIQLAAHAVMHTSRLCFHGHWCPDMTMHCHTGCHILIVSLLPAAAEDTPFPSATLTLSYVVLSSRSVTLTQRKSHYFLLNRTFVKLANFCMAIVGAGQVPWRPPQGKLWGLLEHDYLTDRKSIWCTTRTVRALMTLPLQLVYVTFPLPQIITLWPVCYKTFITHVNSCDFGVKRFQSIVNIIYTWAHKHTHTDVTCCQLDPNCPNSSCFRWSISVINWRYTTW